MPPEDQGQAASATDGAPEGAKPAQGSGTAAPAGAAAPATGDDPLGDQGKAALEAERTIRRDAEKALREAGFVKQGDKWVNTAAMNESEKHLARIKELEEQTAGADARERVRSLRVAAVETASALGFRNPSLAWRLLDPADVKYEDDGTPKNVETLLKKIAEAEPYLVGGSGQDYGGGNRGKAPSGQAPTMDELLRAAARGS